MSWDCSMHPSVVSENEDEKFHLYLYSEYRLNPKSHGTSVHLFWGALTLLYVGDLDCVCIFTSDVWILMQEGYLEIYISQTAVIQYHSHIQKVWRGRRERLYLFITLWLQNIGWKVSTAVRVFPPWKILQEIKAQVTLDFQFYQ